MLLTNSVVIKLNNRDAKFYQSKGYDVSDLYLEVLVEDLPKCSMYKVEVKCDYCGDIYTQTYGDYSKSIKTINKNSCKKCKYKKVKEVNLYKYGVINVSCVDSIKKKKVATCVKNYGCEYPMQNKEIIEKSRRSMIEHYGVPNNIYRECVSYKIKEGNSYTKYKKGNAPSSKAQRYICSLFEGKLNYPVGYYNLDVLLPNNIYIEYNGSGHKLNVKLNNITEQEYKIKETYRYKYIKSMGYKEIIFDNLSDILPTDDILIGIKEYCVDTLINTENNWIRVDLDTMKITTKNTEISYSIS